MTAYGAKVYGSFRYGANSTTDISVYPFTAKPLNYGSINLSWVFPLGTASFSQFVIVRNPMGFPTTADNGDIIYKNTYAGLSTLYGTTGTLVDDGSYYDPITGSKTPSYTGSIATGVVNSKVINLTTVNSNLYVGQAVSYTASGNLTGANAGSGVVGGTTIAAIDNTSIAPLAKITLSDYATIPAGTTLTFSPTPLSAGKTYYYSAFILNNSFWTRVGTALSTTIKNYSTADVMYDSLPEIYKSTSPVSGFSTANKNIDLYNFLRTVAVQYDLIKTKVDNAKNRYDVSSLDGRLIPALMNQMGFTYESGLGVQQGRRLLTHADYIYLNKGTGQGLKQFVSSFSGYGVSLAPIKNLFLTSDCAGFNSGDGFWSATGTQSSITYTNSTTEGGSPSPYFETASPAGYPNNQTGFLKFTATSAVATTGTAYEFSYGTDITSYTISTSVTNNINPSYYYTTLTTDTEHGFTVGQSVVVQGMSPAEANGIWKIVAVPNTKSFSFWNYNLYTGGGAPTIAPTNTSGTVALYNPVVCGIPISQNTAYCFSIASIAKAGQSPASRNNIVMGIRWYDQFGSYISSTTASGVSNSTVWARVNFDNQVSPLYSAYAVPFIQFAALNSGEVHYFDSAQFEQATVTTTYADSRRVDIYLNPVRINQVINPGFELDRTGWTTTGVNAGAGGFVTDSSNVYPTSAIGLGTAVSTKSVKLTSTATTVTLYPNSTIAVTPGNAYAFSAYVKGPSPDTASLRITWKDAGGSTIGTPVNSGVSTISTSFSRVSMVANAPATAATATLLISLSGTIGDIYYVDSVLFESSFTVNPYFDGGTGYNVTDDLIWEQNAAGTKGTASTGRSLYYPNRTLVQSRLNTVIPDYLPTGTNFAMFIGTTAT